MSRDAAEWMWKYGIRISQLPEKQYKRFILVLQMLNENKISLDEASILVG
jgi:hypothetical protein